MRKMMFALVLWLAAGLPSSALAQSQEWPEFSPTGSRCFVKMPTKPEEKSETTDSKHGKYTTHLFIARTDVATYLFGWVDYAPDYHPDKQAEMEANRDNLLKNVQAKLTSNRKISLTEEYGVRKMSLVHPGIEFTAESPSRMIRSRVYMVDYRPYQLVAVWESGKEEPPGVALFFSSFRLEHRKSRETSGAGK